MVAGEGVADQHRVALRGIQLAVGFDHQVVLGQGLAAGQLERFVEVQRLGRPDRRSRRGRLWASTLLSNKGGRQSKERRPQRQARWRAPWERGQARCEPGRLTTLAWRCRGEGGATGGGCRRLRATVPLQFPGERGEGLAALAYLLGLLGQALEAEHVAFEQLFVFRVCCISGISASLAQRSVSSRRRWCRPTTSCTRVAKKRRVSRRCSVSTVFSCRRNWSPFFFSCNSSRW